VQDGDVVAMIETDKVTIEVKATASGVVTQHFGKL
jgi:pyruvate/2-oxoglutarate dehydrogenase complex dihydrolipoamide acyltransferase (E2) component